MRLGIATFPTDLSMQPHHLAKEVEERGFESLWFSEHTHVPTIRATPHPQRGQLPDEYRRMHDPLIALAVAAAVTSTIRLGTGVCLIAQRDLIITAKEVSSLDVLSDGRVIFGVGYGWNIEEMAQHGVDPSHRRALVREKMLAIRELWTSEVAAFAGEHVRLNPSWQWPKPVQSPHPPVYIGGAATSRVHRDIVEYADGWLATPSVTGEQIESLRRTAKAQGREVGVAVFGAQGSDIDRLEDIGVDRVALRVPSLDREAVLPVLDDYAALLG